MIDIKALDIPLLRLLTFIQVYSLTGFHRNHRIYYLIILCIEFQRIQDQILKRSLGPLIKLSIESSDYYQRTCVLDFWKITLPPSLYQELNFLWCLVQLHYQFSQFKLLENTTKYIQSKLDTDKFGQDWTRPQQFDKCLAPIKYYKSKSQYFPTKNIPHPDADASQIDISSRGKYSVPIKNMDV